jgi:hypothetical protein
VEAVLAGLEAAPRGAAGVPEGAGASDARLLGAARRDLLGFVGRLYTLFGTAPRRGSRGTRGRTALTALGWARFSETYVPKKPSGLAAALGLEGRATAAARDAAARCGALCGSFREGADTLGRLTGVRVSASKLRAATLAFGKACAAAQEKPEDDVRTYAKKPRGAAKEVGRTLFFMSDGGSANCCGADTRDAKGKDGGDADTRMIRAGVFGEYGWLDREGRPVPWPESYSYIVLAGGDIGAFTSLARRHGLARGCGAVPRMQCMADGEAALESSCRDAFPDALFGNDFAHASDHLHACCLALGLAEAAAEKEYRFCRGLLYRSGAESAARRVRRLYRRRLEASPQALKDLLYLEKRRDNMRYGWLRRNGYYIGSGHVEAAVRVLIVRRTKQAGMHWRLANAVLMAAIHARYRSHPSAA